VLLQDYFFFFLIIRLLEQKVFTVGVLLTRIFLQRFCLLKKDTKKTKKNMLPTTEMTTTTSTTMTSRRKVEVADALAGVIGTLVSLWAFYSIELIKTNLQAGGGMGFQKSKTTNQTTTSSRKQK
jgi:hypothetical protein